MLSKNLENPIIVVSVRVYQALLIAYPTKFQKEYGPHMLQVFRDCCLRTFRQGGRYGMLKLWALTLFDLLRSSIEEHLQKETFMTRSKFIRLSGWSLILGAVTLFLFILGTYLDNNVGVVFRRFRDFYEFGFQMSVWATPVLLGIGLLGLRTRYGDEVGSFGKNILLFGAIAGPVINIAGTFYPAIVGDWGWLLPYTGTAVLLACLTIFGIPALSAKPLPRWDSLPIIAGIWYPVIIVLAYIFETVGISYDLGNPAYIAIPLQCILLIILGYMLQADVPEETPAIA